MKVFTRKCMYGLLGAGLTVSSAGSVAAPGTLASKPLWMGASVKTNVILALDDSGSMQWDMIFPADQGRLSLNSDKSFFNAVGTTGYEYHSGGTDFNSLNPWVTGVTSNYDVPPIDAYGFARSPDYNGMYYNPNDLYKPWPVYGDYKPSKGPFNGQTLVDSFPNADITNASGVYLGPFNSGKTKLFESVLGEFLVAKNMVYNEAGEKSPNSTNITYNWRVATYFLKKTTGSYTYTETTISEGVSTADNVLLEAEDGIYDSPMGLGSCSYCNIGALTTPGSAGDSNSSPPANGEVELSFAAPGEEVKIWLRVYASGTGSNSFWMKLDGKDKDDFSAASGDSGVWVDDYEKLDEINTSSSWQWKEWGTISNLTEDDTYKLRIKKRESGTWVDQVLITTTSDVPSGVMKTYDPSLLAGVTRSCNPTDLVNADINGLTYHDDFRLRKGTFFINDDKGTPALTDDTATTNELGGIGPDGACLVKYVIPKTGAFDNGATATDRIGKSLAVEQQNFANWFMYYSRRYYAMQGGVGNALNSVGNVRVGWLTINNNRDPVTMWDLDESTGQGSFLAKHYDVYNANGSTDLRGTLKYAGEQYKRTNTGAPIISECQKNFTLLFSDGFNSTLSYSGVGNEDSGKGKPFEDSYSGTLADVADKYFNTTLRTGASFPAGAVPVSKACEDNVADAWADCKTDLHMNTYTVGFGVEGTIFDQNVPDVVGKKFNTRENAHIYKDDITWPNVNSASDQRQVDDMYHAAVNGYGETYSASSPTALQTKLQNALDDIIAESGSGSGVTFNSSSLNSSGGSGVYFTGFNAANWTGNLIARKVLGADTATQKAGELSSDTPWGTAASPGAATILDARDITASPRVIYTFDGTDGVVFDWSKLTANQKADLQAGGTEDDGKARLAYFQGNKSNEGNATTYGFRARASRMGDVINSTPVYVGIPASNWPETSDFGTGGSSHRAFKEAKKDRTPTVWVAANDGMLHGFDARLDQTAGGGKELLAYIPSAVFKADPSDGLSYLTSTSYVHKYYNDLSPVAQDVRLTIGASTEWHTVLVGGLGAGGKGIYALDVTDPTKFTNTGVSDTNPAKVVMWEFDSTDDADMGYLVNPPSIAKMNDGSWAVIFGNGYNSTASKTALFIVRIAQGIDGTWTAATDYTKIVIPTSSDGLSGVALADLDGDRIVDRAYGGDLHGNMWAFDLSSDTATDWDVAYDSSGVQMPLFKAVNADSVAQPITAAPNLAYNTETTKAGNEPNVLVGFGTGQYLSLGDNTNTDVQSFYIVWDRGANGTTNDGLVRTNLVQRKLEFEKAAYLEHGTIDISSDSDDAIDWNAPAASLKYGWYMDFIVGSTKYGERLITKPLFRSSEKEGIVAVFITRIPNTDSACSGGGKSSLYAMPILTGLSPSEPLIDLDGDGDVDAADGAGTGKEFNAMYDDPNILSDNIYAACSTGEDCVDVTKTKFGESSARTGRLGWHELINE